MTFDELYQKVIKQEPLILDKELIGLSEEDLKIILKSATKGLAGKGDTEISIARLTRIVRSSAEDISDALIISKIWEQIRDGRMLIIGESMNLPSMLFDWEEGQEMIIEGEVYKVEK